jgi:uncharacterized protein (TIGR02001 family)
VAEGRRRGGGFSTSANIEWDIYGGYKFEVVKDWTVDLGYLRYEYPSSSEFSPKPNTDEIYAGLSYGPATLKYSYSINNTFGVPNSKGSDYIELAINHPIIDKVTLNAILGHQNFKNNSALSYTVWKIGATYDFGNGFNVGRVLQGHRRRGSALHLRRARTGARTAWSHSCRTRSEGRRK